MITQENEKSFDRQPGDRYDKEDRSRMAENSSEENNEDEESEEAEAEREKHTDWGDVDPLDNINDFPSSMDPSGPGSAV